MKKALVFVNGEQAGILVEKDDATFSFSYDQDYQGEPISLTMPKDKNVYEFNKFPPFFDGLLPEGFELEALLKNYKIDRYDYFTQMVTVGADLVGAVTVKEIE
ncbi:MAG: HipA N-terminal domain-containing protein [Pseudomonadota bacterium]